MVEVETPSDLQDENAPAPNIAGETLGEVKRRTGYTIKDLQENFPPIEKWAELGVRPAEANRVQTEAKLESYDQQRRGNVTTYQRISLPLNSVRGHFVVLLYPHRRGDTLPTMAWSGNSVKISWPNQADEYAFSIGPDGRTRIRLDRQGSGTLAIE